MVNRNNNNNNYQYPSYTNPYSAMEGGVPSYNIGLLTTPTLDPVVKPEAEMIKTMEYQQKKQDSAIAALDAMDEIKAKVRSTPNLQHQQIVQDAINKLNSRYSPIVESGDYGNNVHSIRSGAKEFINNKALQDAIKAEKQRNLDFSTIDKTTGYRDIDRAGLKSYYDTNIPDINPNDPSGYTYAPKQITAWEDPMKDLAGALKALVTPDEYGHFTYNAEAVAGHPELNGIIKSVIKDDKYIDYNKLQNAAKKYILSQPKYIEMFNSRNEIGMANHTQADFDKWATEQANGLASMAMYNQHTETGNVQFVPNPKTSGSGSGSGTNLVPGQSVQSTTSSMDGIADTGFNTKTYNTVYKKYMTTIDEALDFSNGVNNTQSASNLTNADKIKKAGVVINDMDKKINLVTDIISKNNEIINDVNSTQAEKDEATKKINNANNVQFDDGKGGKITLAVYKEKRNAYMNARDKALAADTRMNTSLNKFYKDNGFYIDNKFDSTVDNKKLNNAIVSDFKKNKDNYNTPSATQDEINKYNTSYSEYLKAKLGNPNDAIMVSNKSIDLYKLGTKVAMAKAKQLLNSNTDKDKEEFTDRLTKGTRLLSNMGYGYGYTTGNIENILNKAYNTDNKIISKADYDNMMFALAVTYEDAWNGKLGDVKVGNIMPDYTEALELTDEHLDNTAILTTEGATTNNANGSPYAGWTSKSTINLEDKTKKDIEQAIKDYPSGVVVGNNTKQFFEGILQDPKDLNLDNGYNPMNATNTVTLNNIADKGFKIVDGSSQIIYTPNTESGMMIKMTIKKDTKTKSVGGDISSVGGQQGYIYVPISKGTGGVNTPMLLNKMAEPNQQLINWLLHNKFNTGNNDNFNIKHRFDVSKLPNNTKDISIDFKAGKVYYQQIQKGKPVTVEGTIDSEWNNLVNAFIQ